MNLFSLIQDSVATGIETWLCYVFCSIFLDVDFFKKRKMQFASAAVASVLIVEVGDFFLPFSLGRSMVSSTLVFYLLQIIIYRKYYMKCAALSLFYMLMLAMSDFSILVVCSLTSGKPFDVFLSMSVYRVIATVIHTLVLSFIVWLMYHISENTFQMGKRYVISLLVLSILILVTTLLIFQYFLSMGHVGLTDFFVWGMLVALSLVSFFYIIRLARTYTVQQENMLLNMHNEMLHKSLEENRKSYEVWRSKIHDYKHHLIYMTELAEAGDFDRLKDYLNREMGDIRRDMNIVKSGYAGIDSILNSKQILAQSHHLHMFCHVKLPENLVLDNAAIASVLGNLLDNAITAGASVSGSSVEVNIYMVKNNLCMKICNQTVSQQIDFTHTSTSDRLLHGIGLRSVRSSVEKMDGEFSIREQDGVVTAFVTLYHVCP